MKMENSPPKDKGLINILQSWQEMHFADFYASDVDKADVHFMRLDSGCHVWKSVFAAF
jgi:hypothetical protein